MKMFELMGEGDRKMLITIDDEQSVELEVYLGESVIGRVTLSEEEIMEFTCLIFEELEVCES